MPKTKEQKKKIVEELIDKLNQSKSAVFLGYKGLTMPEIQELREKMEEQEATLKVVKNTLFRIALKESDLKDLKLPSYTEPLALAFGFKEELAPAKITYDFAKEHEVLKILGGIFDRKLISKEEVESLAKLPNREELLAKIVYTIRAPMPGIVNVLRANLNNLVGVLRSISIKAT